MYLFLSRNSRQSVSDYFSPRLSVDHKYVFSIDVSIVDSTS